MPQKKIMDMRDFELGEPALVCRWRLANRHLPLQNRHLRALLARRLNGTPVSKELVAWAKQHLEWTLEQGAVDHPNGVLMLIVDREGRAAMTVGPYEELTDRRLEVLVRRARAAEREARSTNVAPEVLWVARGDELLWEVGEDRAACGCASLVAQLAQTMGLVTRRSAGLLDQLEAGTLAFDEAFLVSDEHGVVPASDAAGHHGQRMAEGYQVLLARA